MKTEKSLALKRLIFPCLVAWLIASGPGCDLNPSSDTVEYASLRNTAIRQNDSAPQLLLPPSGAVMDNGRTDRQDPIIWDFSWSAVPKVSFYEIFVIHQGSRYPVIDCLVHGTSYHSEEAAYIIDANRFAWTWKVRGVRHNDSGNRILGPWSEERAFEVEPVDTDAPSR